MEISSLMLAAISDDDIEKILIEQRMKGYVYQFSISRHEKSHNDIIINHAYLQKKFNIK